MTPQRMNILYPQRRSERDLRNHPGLVLNVNEVTDAGPRNGWPSDGRREAVIVR